jgi:hypothetical protein
VSASRLLHMRLRPDRATTGPRACCAVATPAACWGLVEDGWAARATHTGVRVHLLVVSDLATEPAAFGEVRRLRPRLYSSRMRHASWVDLCGFLGGWMSRPEWDAGHRRMIADALAVMAK